MPRTVEPPYVGTFTECGAAPESWPCGNSQQDRSDPLAHLITGKGTMEQIVILTHVTFDGHCYGFWSGGEQVNAQIHEMIEAAKQEHEQRTGRKVAKKEKVHA